mgnify:CR=1 FL=1
MIEDLKALLGLPEEIDGALENKLLLILKATKQRLRFLLGGLEPPEEMNYIILDVSIIRFNRIGSEGLSSHSVEGKAFPGQKMILRDTWMISGHIWMIRKNQRKVR